MTVFSLVAPRTADEAIALIAAVPPGEAAVIAGGTDLLLDLDNGRLSPARIVSLRHLPWKNLEWSGDSLTIGSTLPLRDLETDPELRVRLPGLWQAVRAVGGVALRHRATIGGNLARSAPASDLLPILLALDAEVDLVGPSGARTIPLDRLLRASRTTTLAPGELIRSVRIPEARPSTFLWQRVRPANDISQVGVALARSPVRGSWQIAVGGVVPRPIRIGSAERLLSGPSPSAGSVEAAAREAAQRSPFASDRRASEEYRRRLVSTLVVRAVGALAMPAGGGP